MKIRSLGLVFMFLAAALPVAAQKKTVTNADLERYKAERTKSEDALRDEYARKGISPEEVARRNKKSQEEMIALSAKLRAERLETEKLDAQRLAAEQSAAANRRAAASQYYYEEPYFWNGAWYGGGFVNGRRGRFGRVPYQQPGYFAGGQFWPTAPSTPPRPAFSVPRGRR